MVKKPKAVVKKAVTKKAPSKINMKQPADANTAKSTPSKRGAPKKRVTPVKKEMQVKKATPSKVRH